MQCPSCFSSPTINSNLCSNHQFKILFTHPWTTGCLSVICIFKGMLHWISKNMNTNNKFLIYNNVLNILQKKIRSNHLLPPSIRFEFRRSFHLSCMITLLKISGQTRQIKHSSAAKRNFFLVSFFSWTQFYHLATLCFILIICANKYRGSFDITSLTYEAGFLLAKNDYLL